MNVPRNAPTDASSIHGEPLSSSMTPQAMKKANATKVRMANVNFMVVILVNFVIQASA